MTEAEIRADERRRIAAHMRTVACASIRDVENDAIDGYAAAVVLDLADTIEKFNPDQQLQHTGE